MVLLIHGSTQLTLEQHGSELCGSAYTEFFSVNTLENFLEMWQFEKTDNCVALKILKKIKYMSWLHKIYIDSRIFYHLLPYNQHLAISKVYGKSKYAQIFDCLGPVLFKGQLCYFIVSLSLLRDFFCLQDCTQVSMFTSCT